MKRIVINDPRTSRFVAQANGSDDFSNCFSIGFEHGGEIVGGLLYDNWNKAQVCLHIAGKPGVRWITRGGLKLVFGYAYDVLKVRRVTGMVCSKNTKAIRFAEKCGFTYETRMRDAHPNGDLLVYSLFKQHCRWILPRSLNHA